MTLRSLEIFVAVVKYGKMSEASKQLHIAQPTISQAISELEREYGVLLFDRLSKKLYITEAGQQLFGYAQSILALSNEMEKNMLNLSLNKTITLGATMTVGKCVLVDIVRDFEEMYPNIKIQVIIDNTATIENMLLNSEIDIAIIEGTVKSTELISSPIIPDDLVLVCHKNNSLSKRKCIDIEELSSYPFVLREEGSGTREVFEDYIRKKHIPINVKWNCHSSDSIVEAVLANQGITVISKRLVENQVQEGNLKIIPINNIKMERSFSLVHHKTKYLSQWLKCFIEYVKDLES